MASNSIERKHMSDTNAVIPLPDSSSVDGPVEWEWKQKRSKTNYREMRNKNG